jgi:hypothetical protein
MVNAKEEIINGQEYRRVEKLAGILGITHDELDQTEWKFDEGKSEEGRADQLLVIFDKNSPENILHKIIGLDDNFTVRLDPNDLDSHEEIEEEELGGEG